MKKLKPVPIGEPLLFAFGTLCMILLIVGSFIFFGLRSIERETRQSANEMTRSISEIATIGDGLIGLAILVAIGTGYSVARVGRRLKEDNRLLRLEVAERTRSEEVRQREREFFAVLLENISDGILACDANGVITLSNRTLREFHGLPTEPVPFERWSEYFAIHMPDGTTPLASHDRRSHSRIGS